MIDAALDKIDRKILEVLQGNGRLTNLEVAERVNLSPSPCLRRIRRLEETGVIRQYAALLEPRKIGLGLLAYVNVRLEKQGGAPKGKTPADLFRAAIEIWPEVVACYAMTGEMDFLLKVYVEDMEHFSRFMKDQLLSHPSVIDVRSSFALESIKETTALPLPASLPGG
ncbi:Lrp/AsnC family transcriptional regulator [Imbroritus primus]|uniref:Lrp/AsnC family transcriptional regulator n=1 Tax=Imbroritus primus TaxID=3058603 RepID=A0ACD3SNS2_9BURK|nr:Lrp/AsnC family transcriptional regulator [Burkholderiaceae bacterium PBA]